jgi:CheY-like chemotaxis protein
MNEGGRTILVVDDDDDIREVLREVLEQRQHHVIAAQNGADALVVLRTVQVDAIVLDLTMPRLDGRSFLDVRARLPALNAVPVIVVTASRDASLDGDARIQAVLRKPFTANQLAAVVEEWSTARADRN